MIGRTDLLTGTAGVSAFLQYFRILGQVPFVPQLYSKKFNRLGYRYEIAVCIKTGLIVLVNGPFKAGLPDKIE